MDLEFKVIGIAYAICAGILFLGVVPYYAVKHLGGENASPIPKGRVPVRGFGLPDIVGVSLLFGFYAGVFQLSRFEPADPELVGAEGLVYGLMFSFLLQALQIAFVLLMLFRRVNLVEAFGLRWRTTWWKVVYAPAVVLVMLAFIVGLDFVGYNEWLGQFIEGDGVQVSV